MAFSPLPLTGPFQVGAERGANGLHVALAGELDLLTVPLLTYELDLDPEVGPVIVDLAELSFIDFSGLAVFVAAAERAERRGRPFKIVNPTPRVRRVFELTGADHLLATNAQGE
ncbi:MAG: anti-sigma factor antagonist [Actinomycetota bacterium]|nr:anti-sigma factor antagonist [Actinomycetota bacterium]